MTLCADDHEEICYEGRRCPCCDVLAEKRELEETVAQLEKENSELETQLADLE